MGLFLKDNIFVAFNYSLKETDYSIIGQAKSELQEDKFTVSSKWVHKFWQGKAINLEGGIEIIQFENVDEDGTNNLIYIVSDYYLNRKTSIGTKISFNTGDDKTDEGKTFALGIVTYLNPHFYIRVSFEKFLSDNNPKNDSQFTSAGIGLRF